MAPSRPQPSRAWSRSGDQSEAASGDQQHMQAGRASANIAAQMSAQSLREAARPGSQANSRANSREPSRVGTPNLLRKKSKPQPEVNIIPEDSPRRDTEALLSPIRPTTAATVDTLEPTPSTTSSHDFAERNSSEEGASSLSGSASESKASTTAPLTGQLSTSSSRNPLQHQTSRSYFASRPGMSLHNDSTLSLTRQTTPRSVRDLGSDYTRYYNPFASRNSSSTDLAGTPLPRYNSSSHLIGGITPGVSSVDLNRRLSNPFGDRRRYSNPFASQHTTAPGTRTGSPDREKGGMGMSATSLAASSSSHSSSVPGTPLWLREADPEKIGFFPFMDDRLGAPTYDFPLFSDQREDDDDMHMPQWDDDIRLKPKFKDHFTRENVVSTIGLSGMIIGLLCVFVVLPVVSYTTKGFLDYSYETPLDQMYKDARYKPEAWAQVNNETYSLMKNVRTGLIDPDTPSSAKTKKGVKGDEYTLVFSDEFNDNNRTFYEGDDPYFYGFDGWYGATIDLEWYDPDAIKTGMYYQSSVTFTIHKHLTDITII